MINVVIPMAGRGSRFEQAGYTFPKPLIDVNNKPMIQVVVDNLSISGRYIFLVLKEHYEKYALKYLLPLITQPNQCEIVIVDGVTEGAACTVLLAEEHINNNDELILANSDQWINWNSDHFINYMRDKNADGGILTFHACFGYNTLIDTKEFGKIPIGKIVTQKLDCSVLSFNEQSKEFEYCKIKDFVRLDGTKYNWKKITSDWGGVTYATEDHQFLTKNGWEEIGMLKNNIITSFKCMSNMQKEIFDGTMLGDGSISIGHNRVNSGLKFSHSIKQKDWAMFKLNKFSSIGIGYDFYNDGKYESVACRTNINEEFKAERQRWYPDGKKIVPKDISFTPLSIAVWYMDDGGLTTNKTQTARFSTNSFTYDDVVFLQTKFSEINIGSYLVNDNNQYRLVVNAESSDRFFNMIANYIVPQMNYKLPEKYRGKFDETLYFNNERALFYTMPRIDSFNEQKSFNKYAFCLTTENGNFVVDNMVAHNCHPKWSFAKVEEGTGLITEVAEKKPISNIATVGVYYFKHGNLFVSGAKQMIEKNIRTNNEFYVCPVFNEVIGAGHNVYSYPVAEMKGLGTPEDLALFLGK